MGTILDIILCIIILCFVFSGIKTGFVRSLIDLIGTILAIVISVVLSNRFAGIIYGYFMVKNSSGVLDYAIAKVIITAALFFLLQLLVRFVAGALDAVFRVPVLHQINAALGGVIGLVKGVAVVFLLCAALQLLLPLITAKYPQITPKEIGKSYIYQTSYVNNPIYRLFEV